MKIGLFTDTHYCTKEVIGHNRYPLKSAERLKIALREFKENDVDLIICLGDLVDSDDSTTKNKENLKYISSLIHKTGIEAYCCMGNHDAFLFEREEFETISGLNIAPLIVEKKGRYLIFLDGNYTKDGNPYSKGNVDWMDTFIPPKQVDFLKEGLLNAKEKNYTVSIFIHQNIDTNLQKDHQIHNAVDIQALIEDSGIVQGVWQGHFHPGAINTHSNVRYETLPAMCEYDNSFRIVEI